jgi:hypothetical protein
VAELAETRQQRVRHGGLPHCLPVPLKHTTRLASLVRKRSTRNWEKRQTVERIPDPRKRSWTPRQPKRAAERGVFPREILDRTTNLTMNAANTSENRRYESPIVR